MGFIDDTDWTATLILNVARAVVAGCIWSAVTAFGFFGADSSALTVLYQFPLSYFFAGLPLALIDRWFADRGAKYAGIVSGVAAIAIIVADPLIYALRSFVPRWIPSDFKLINRVLVILVSPNREVAVPTTLKVDPLSRK